MTTPENGKTINQMIREDLLYLRSKVDTLLHRLDEKADVKRVERLEYAGVAAVVALLAVMLKEFFFGGVS